jgi:hypothetical protein
MREKPAGGAALLGHLLTALTVYLVHCTEHSIQYSVHCTLYTVELRVESVQHRVYMLLCKVNILKFLIYSVL